MAYDAYIGDHVSVSFIGRVVDLISDLMVQETYRANERARRASNV